MSPYDLRRTLCPVIGPGRNPHFRQSYYLGHGPKNLDQLYQRTRAWSEYSREDAAALSGLVGKVVISRVVK